ncbi:MAG: hypothetical protein HZA62_10420 [Rhodocyclales bacterium]|nr:hypothetical protein [Rhodocyclales bacterium]
MNRHATSAAISGRGILRRALCALALLLTACGNTQSAYLDDGGGLSLSVVREQSYLGGPWHSTLISAATPRCQKRHRLEGLSEDGFQLKVFRPEPGVYILNSGKRWYVTELRNCEFQTYKSPPPFPGEAIGRFEAASQVLAFIADKPAKR